MGEICAQEQPKINKNTEKCIEYILPYPTQKLKDSPYKGKIKLIDCPGVSESANNVFDVKKAIIELLKPDKEKDIPTRKIYYVLYFLNDGTPIVDEHIDLLFLLHKYNLPILFVINHCTNIKEECFTSKNLKQFLSDYFKDEYSHFLPEHLNNIIPVNLKCINDISTPVFGVNLVYNFLQNIFFPKNFDEGFYDEIEQYAGDFKVQYDMVKKLCIPMLRDYDFENSYIKNYPGFVQGIGGSIVGIRKYFSNSYTFKVDEAKGKYLIKILKIYGSIYQQLRYYSEIMNWGDIKVSI